MPSSRAPLLALAPVLAALVACGSSPAKGGTGGASSESSSSASTTTTGTGGTGGTGGSTPCAPGSHLADAGACVTTLEPWTQASSLLTARDHHVTFVAQTSAGNFLYVAGGTNDAAVFSSVERATIAADGTLSAFKLNTALPMGILGMGLAQVGNSVVIAGGADGMSSLANAFVGTVSDKAVLAWTAGPSLNTDRYHVSLSVYGGYVYAVGGLQQKVVNGNPMQTIVATVERATFDGTTLGAWETIDPLPMPLTHQAAVVYEHALYLIGGISDIASPATLTTIQRAPFTADNKLGAWQTVGMLPDGRGTSAAFMFLGQLYVVAGADMAQGGEVATVLRATVAADGSVGAFDMLAPLPMPRAHVHQAPVFQDVVYSAGGIHATMMQKQVYAAKLD